MFDHPERIDLALLESRHEEYDQLMPIWVQIKDLLVGGHELAAKREQYITRRPGETEDLYQLRLKKFSYTPLLSGSVQDLTTRLTSAPYHVSGVEGDQWDNFRGATDGKRRDERALLSKIFRTQIAFGRCWAFVDRTAPGIQPQNKLQEELLGIRTHVTLFNPMQVLNWSLRDNEVEFIKTRQIISETSPYSPPKLKAIWMIDDTSIARYEAYIELDSTGNIVSARSIYEPESTKNASPVSVPQIQITHGYPLLHGRGKCPIVYMPIEEEQWVCNAAYLKSRQHLEIENAWTDSAVTAGYVQRVLTPRDPLPDSDPSMTFSDPDEGLQDIKSSNAHILIAKDFKFAEASGSSLQTISEFVLDKIEFQIKAIVAMGNISASREALMQSGISKALDYVQVNLAMKSYGQNLIQGYEEVLKHVAISFGIKDEAVLEEIKVSGLDSFDTDGLEAILEQSERVLKLEEKLSPTTLKLWWVKLSEAMHGSVDAETKQTIRDEYEKSKGEALTQ
jgi:hypothetical protein